MLELNAVSEIEYEFKMGQIIYPRICDFCPTFLKCKI